MQCRKNLLIRLKWTLIEYKPSSIVVPLPGSRNTGSAGVQCFRARSSKQLFRPMTRSLCCFGRPGFLQCPQYGVQHSRSLSTGATQVDSIELHRKRLRAWFSHMPNEEMKFGSFSIDNWHIDPVIAESSPKENRELTSRLGVYSHIEPEKSRVLKANQMFSSLSDTSAPAKNVLLYGMVGMGKSTVVNKLVLDWCDGRLDQFDLILPFSCEDLSSQNQSASLNKLIVRKYTQLRSILPQIWSGKLGKVLLVFSDLEQLKLDFRLSKTELCNDPNEPLPPSSLLVNLLRNYLIPDANILVTTLPSDVDSVPSRYVDRYVRICGFTDVEQQHQYFRRRLNLSPYDTASENLMKMLYKNLQRQSQLTADCFLPSYCWIICANLHFLHFTTADMPIQNLTGLYSSFLTLNFGGQIVDASSQQNISIVRYIAKTVGKLAYEGIEKKKMLFSEEDLQNCFELHTKTEGELNQLTAFQTDVLGFFMSPTAQHHTEPLLRFTVPAMQEYLAALYVVLGEKKTVLERVGNVVSETIGKASEDVTAILAIVSKLVPFRIITLLRLVNIFPRIFGKINTKSKKAIANTMVFEMFKEDDELNNDVLEQINESILGKEVGVSNPPAGDRTSTQCFELFPMFMAGLLAQSNRLLLEKLGCTIKNVTVREISNSLKKHLSKVTIEKLPPSELMDLLLFLYELQNEVFAREVCKAFQSLTLSQVKMTTLKCFVIASIMNTTDHPIDVMNLSLCNLSEDCLKILRPVLLRCKNLNLQFNNLGLGAWQEVSRLLQDPNCTVQNLWLCDNVLSEAAVNCIGPAIARNSSVTQLSLLHTSLGDQGVKVLTPYIRENARLKDLNLASNDISEEAAVTFVEMIKKHPTLETLHLYLNEISDSGKKELHALSREQDGVKVLASITDGSNISAYWTLILKNVTRNATNRDQEHMANYLTLFQNELKFSRQQVRNPWKKLRILRVEHRVEKLLRNVQQGK
ncbi:NLR family member X1 [Hemiscyllium ocellatum]|uniref:NLR family member X1 n=1 Tax=Hemiscyllium ocellatum TaxID=170820 RepID=UPI002966D4CC|nr:NLR family member X1 [Hemiscyllium ocellatum]XP_060702943.1 NLR family member X1 [Hemiscyllium ocellatum]XP_060702944.1 NLR family member X1 [Hemiscyllium ocellatum]XP_060702945.1 NLR family member X1 [Hemiscyllium ocellatum]XP_060702946.1 NLR family member X1 [Hemiscyllium ocellatum]XP_060702947.1 NLR family member X1 [Hemiscyllium ocellatum]XP_060702948.1 NLR family member X1 [Hemiscyllium ocellatum]